MTWFKVDDGFATNPKAQAAGLHGRALWLAAGTQCAAAGTDGRVDGRMVKMYAALAEVSPRRSTDLLVASGLWHDAVTMAECAPCIEVAPTLSPGDFFFHNWWKYQLAAKGKEDPIVRAHEMRRKALLRDTALCAAVRKRDRDVCRYCSTLTTWTQDRRSGTSGTYDHVDPFGDNTLANVVVACRRCNGRKRDRTPAQAGMVLLDEPGPYLAPIKPGLIDGLIDDQASRGHARETGPGQVGSGRDGSGTGPGPEPDQPEDDPPEAA